MLEDQLAVDRPPVGGQAHQLILPAVDLEAAIISEGGIQQAQRVGERDVVDQALANGLIGCLIVGTELESPADDDVIGPGKHVSVLAIEILQIGLRSKHCQLALDRDHLGIAP